MRWLRFYAVSAVGIAINTGALLLIVAVGVLPMLANLAAMGVAMVWNFTVNYLWTWAGR